jgi:hypothetical protein
MSTITCPNCGSNSPAGAIFCDNCGNDLRNVRQSPPHLSPTVAADSVNTVKCQTCGYENQPGSAFCENCGTQLGQPATPQQPVQPPQEQAQPPTPPVSAEEPVQQPVSTEETLPEVPAPEPPSAPASTGPRRLVIQNTNTSLPLIDKPEIILGREDRDFPRHRPDSLRRAGIGCWSRTRKNPHSKWNCFHRGSEQRQWHIGQQTKDPFWASSSDQQWR